MSNVLERLTEGVVERNMLAETQAVVGKWEKSGLLEGLRTEREKSTMAVLLENQAKELLREANTMASGDVQGFAAVAFPIVRRVFAGLIANDLVSVQPMSLPSGLVFFMDFKRGTAVGNTGDRVFETGSSFFGDRLGVEITGGVRIDGKQTEKGYYNLANGYNTSRYNTTVGTASVLQVTAFALSGASDAQKALIRWDPDLLDTVTYASASVLRVPLSALSQSALLAEKDVFATSFAQAAGGAASASAGDSLSGSALAGTDTTVVRRLTDVVTGKGLLPTGDVAGTKYLQLVVASNSAAALASVVTATHAVLSYPIKDNLQGVGDNALGAIKALQPWTFENSSEIPEVELKVDSFSITARTRKLKAAWTPELGQDLNAYHNLDAEVELTSILSEQIGLEIDQEILNDLVKGATAGVKYWSRRPGKFVNRSTGLALQDVNNAVAPPDFTGNVSMWYETLVETINDVSALIHRKTLRGGANFLVCSPEVANVLEFTSGFRASVTNDAEKGTVGAVKVGDLNKKWDIIVHPYFLRNVILVGRKGGSFLESGYVYAPYVPLQSTPTIFDPNTFSPRKAVLTRYGKAMVRPDMYGLVVVEDLEG
jgi:hypothetical protein